MSNPHNSTSVSEQTATLLQMSKAIRHEQIAQAESIRRLTQATIDLINSLWTHFALRADNNRPPRIPPTIAGNLIAQREALVKLLKELTPPLNPSLPNQKPEPPNQEQ